MPFPKKNIIPVKVSEVFVPEQVENQLEFVAKATIINLIRQLSSFSLHVGNIFTELTELLNNISNRCDRLDERISFLRFNLPEPRSYSITEEHSEIISENKIDEHFQTKVSHPDALKDLNTEDIFNMDNLSGMILVEDDEKNLDEMTKKIDENVVLVRNHNGVQDRKNNSRIGSIHWISVPPPILPFIEYPSKINISKPNFTFEDSSIYMTIEEMEKFSEDEYTALIQYDINENNVDNNNFSQSSGLSNSLIKPDESSTFANTSLHITIDDMKEDFYENMCTALTNSDGNADGNDNLSLPTVMCNLSLPYTVSPNIDEVSSEYEDIFGNIMTPNSIYEQIHSSNNIEEMQNVVISNTNVGENSQKNFYPFLLPPPPPIPQPPIPPLPPPPPPQNSKFILYKQPPKPQSNIQFPFAPIQSPIQQRFKISPGTFDIQDISKAVRKRRHIIDSDDTDSDENNSGKDE